MSPRSLQIRSRSQSSTKAPPPLPLPHKHMQRSNFWGEVLAPTSPKNSQDCHPNGHQLVDPWTDSLGVTKNRVGVSHTWSWFLPALFCAALLTTVTPSLQATIHSRPIGLWTTKLGCSSPSPDTWGTSPSHKSSCRGNSHTALLSHSGSLHGTTAPISVGWVHTTGLGKGGGGVGVFGEYRPCLGW